jgi:hypothetical protein
MRRMSCPAPLRPTCLFLILVVCAVGADARAEDEAARRARGHADLVLDRYEHDFGMAKQDDILRTTFTYTNASDHKVTGIGARGDCGCMASKVSATELEPGASGTLEVEFHTLALHGILTKRVQLFTREGDRGRFQIPLSIAIVQGLVVGSSGVSFGDIALGTKPTKSFSLRWYDGVGKPFEITEIDVPAGFAALKRPYASSEDERWRGYDIALTLERDLPLGMHSAEVLVRTTHPDRPRVTLPVSANVCGKIWLQARRLSFGSFRAGRPRTASIKLRPFDEAMRFGAVSARSPSGRILVEVKPDPFMAEQGYWKLIATVPADAAPGSLDQEVIELRTDMPGEELTLLAVRGSVRKAEGPAAAAPKAGLPDGDGRKDGHER